jgi:hypothetical protein
MESGTALGFKAPKADERDCMELQISRPLDNTFVYGCSKQK